MYFGDGGYYCAVAEVMLRYRGYYLQHFVAVPSMIGLTYKISLLNSAVLRLIYIAIMTREREPVTIIVAQVNLKINRNILREIHLIVCHIVYYDI